MPPLPQGVRNYSVRRQIPSNKVKKRKKKVKRSKNTRENALWKLFTLGLLHLGGWNEVPGMMFLKFLFSWLLELLRNSC